MVGVDVQFRDWHRGVQQAYDDAYNSALTLSRVEKMRNTHRRIVDLESLEHSARTDLEWNGFDIYTRELAARSLVTERFTHRRQVEDRKEKIIENRHAARLNEKVEGEYWTQHEQWAAEGRRAATEERAMVAKEAEMRVVRVKQLRARMAEMRVTRVVTEADEGKQRALIRDREGDSWVQMKFDFLREKEEVQARSEERERMEEVAAKKAAREAESRQHAASVEAQKKAEEFRRQQFRLTHRCTHGKGGRSAFAGQHQKKICSTCRIKWDAEANMFVEY